MGTVSSCKVVIPLLLPPVFLVQAYLSGVKLEMKGKGMDDRICGANELFSIAKNNFLLVPLFLSW